DLTGRIDPVNQTALVTGLDLTTATDVDCYTFAAPAGTGETLTLGVQSSGLSLLSPKVEGYAADQTTLLGSAAGGGVYQGSTLSVTIAGVTAGQHYYVKVSGAETRTGSWQAFNTGQYALTLNFGTGPSPSVPLPNTSTPNGNPPSGGGGEPEKIVEQRLVNATVSGVQGTFEQAPQATAMDAHGNYVVVWSSYGQDGSGYGVYARRFDANGTPLGNEFRANKTTAGNQLYGAVA